MRRRTTEGENADGATLLALAAEAGVMEMGPEETQAWLNARGWTSPGYLEGRVVNRRAWRASGGDDSDSNVLPEPLMSAGYMNEQGARWVSGDAWRRGLRSWLAGDHESWRDGWL